MIADGIVFTFGKTTTYDTVAYLERRIPNSRRLDPKPSDDYLSEKIHDFQTDRDYEVDCRVVRFESGSKTIAVVPCKPGGKRAMQRIEQYVNESGILIGLGYLGQFDRGDNPPGKIVVPYKIKNSGSLREVVSNLPETVFPDGSIQDGLWRYISAGGFESTMESIHSVNDFGHPNAEEGFYGQEMETGVFVHFANSNQKRSGVVVVSGDPQTGTASENIVIDGKITFQYKRDPRSVASIQFAADSILSFISGISTD